MKVLHLLSPKEVAGVDVGRILCRTNHRPEFETTVSFEVDFRQKKALWLGLEKGRVFVYILINTYIFQKRKLDVVD